MSSLPRVSVIIASYNREETILESVTSVLQQSYTDFELLVVDDGSSDTTVEVLRSITDSRMRVIELETNQGVSAARNTGIENAIGHWVAFQDSDDVWFTEKLQLQMKDLDESSENYVGSYCGMEIEGSGANRYIPDPKISPRYGYIMESLLRSSFISTQTLIVRRDILNGVGRFDPKLLALVDWDLMLRVARKGPIALVDKPLVTQRFSSNSITRSAHKRVTAREKIVEKNIDLLSQNQSLLAFHHHAISGGYRLCNDWSKAAEHLKIAIKLEPTSIRYRFSDIRLRLQRFLNE